jgi:putative oxidoreductase
MHNTPTLSIQLIEEHVMTTFDKAGDLIGRVLLAAIFLESGINKIGGYAGVQGYMEGAGVPGALLPAVIVLEVVGAIAIIVGYKTRIIALLIALFSIAAAFLFHGAADPVQHIMFMKNLAIAGGFLILAARGAGAWSLDARNSRLSAPGEVLRTS